MVICLERGADLHMSQLMPLPLTVSCFSKIQIGFTFLVPLTQVVVDKRMLNGCVCVRARVHVCNMANLYPLIGDTKKGVHSNWLSKGQHRFVCVCNCRELVWGGDVQNGYWPKLRLYVAADIARGNSQPCWPHICQFLRHAGWSLSSQCDKHRFRCHWFVPHALQ